MAIPLRESLPGSGWRPCGCRTECTGFVITWVAGAVARVGQEWEERGSEKGRELWKMSTFQLWNQLLSHKPPKLHVLSTLANIQNIIMLPRLPWIVEGWSEKLGIYKVLRSMFVKVCGYCLGKQSPSPGWCLMHIHKMMCRAVAQTSGKRGVHLRGELPGKAGCDSHVCKPLRDERHAAD